MVRVLSLCLLLLAQNAFAELKGKDRKEFIVGIVDTCYKSQREAEENKAIKDKVLKQYCSCYATYLADLPNSNMYYELASGKKRLSDFSSQITLAANYCMKNYEKY